MKGEQCLVWKLSAGFCNPQSSIAREGDAATLQGLDLLLAESDVLEVRL